MGRLCTGAGVGLALRADLAWRDLLAFCVFFALAVRAACRKARPESARDHDEFDFTQCEDRCGRISHSLAGSADKGGKRSLSAAKL